MSPDQLRRLVDLAGSLRDEAVACAEAKLWRGASVLTAASVEAALLGTVVVFEPELRAGGLWRKGDPESWTLDALIDVARRAGWLPQTLPSGTHPAETLSGDVGDAVAFLKELRNLAAHPGRAITAGGLEFTDDEAMAQVYPVLDGIAAVVFEKLAKRVDALPSPSLS